MKRFRCGIAFKAHRLVYHSTLGSRVINKKMPDKGRDLFETDRIRAKDGLCRGAGGLGDLETAGGDSLGDGLGDGLENWETAWETQRLQGYS